MKFINSKFALPTLILAIALNFGAAFWIDSVLHAASADITLAGNGREVECDTTQRTATIQSGNINCSIYNKSSGSVWVDLNEGTVTTSSGSTSIEVAQGTSLKLPKNCKAFTFKTSSGTSYLIFLAP